jgi:hypothetical protein
VDFFLVEREEGKYSQTEGPTPSHQESTSPKHASPCNQQKVVSIQAGLDYYLSALGMIQDIFSHQTADTHVA